MMSIWITGAYGFIGRHLAKRLTYQGHKVTSIGHGNWSINEAKQWGITNWLDGEINTSNLGLLFKKFGKPDVIFHLAGGSSVGASIENPYQDYQRTVTSGINLLEWVRLNSINTSVVMVSSAAVYGSGHTGPIPESARLHPFSPYGYHKMMLEALCQSYGASYGLQSVIVRLFSVYGAELQKQLLWDACQRLSKGEPTLKLGGNGDEIRDWTEISDVVRLLDSVTTLAKDTAPMINGGSGVGTSIHNIAHILVDAWGTNTPIEFSGQCRPGDPKSLIAKPSINNNASFDWRVNVEKGIPNYVNWFRKKMNEYN